MNSRSSFSFRVKVLDVQAKESTMSVYQREAEPILGESDGLSIKLTVEHYGESNTDTSTSVSTSDTKGW